MRKLATIRLVKETRAIEGADFIELVFVDGWQCVTKKGEFRPGEKAIYFEVDSFLPVRPEFEFLRKGCYKKLPDDSEGFRLKTIRLRGNLSQGLLLPLKFLGGRDPEVGDDVTEALGVVKYEPPVPAQLSGEVLGPFPGFIPKTDQERLQNLVEKIPGWGKLAFELTEKIDGSSGTMYEHDTHFGVCSRNLEMKDTPENTFWRVARELGLPTLLHEHAVQGELAGEGIQGNPYRLRGQHFLVFDVYSFTEKRYLDPEERARFLAQTPLKSIPLLGEGKITSFDQMLASAGGKSALNPKVEREGVVWKQHGPARDRVSFKVVNNEFLLKHEQ